MKTREPAEEKAVTTVRKFLSIFILFVSALLCGRAAAQATVSGGQGTYIYVDGQSGSDSNPGTSSQPFKTIQAGVDKARTDNQAGVASVVSIAPGVYRESVKFGPTNASVPITVEAATPGTVYIDGADVLSGGNANSSGVYTFAWDDTIGNCQVPPNWITGMPPVVLANEMVFLNGGLLTQVMSSTQLVPGTFYVDKSNQRVDVDPPSGTDMSRAKVEVSARQTTLTVYGASGVVFSGLVFQHAASCMNQDGAMVYSGTNILFDNVQANWNNWGGLGISSSNNITVRNSTASHNGGLGFMGYEIQNGLFSNNEADYNNWRGDMVGFYDFAQGGFKFGRNRNVTVDGQHSYNNQGEGLWFDTDNENITVTNAVLVGNTVENLKLEANEGPFTITKNTFCSGGVGVILMDSAGVTLSGNYFYGNQSSGNQLADNQNAQIFLAGQTGGRTYSNFQTGAMVTSENKNITFSGNTFGDSGSGQYLFNTYLSGYEWTDFLGSFHSSGNTWSDATNANAFRVPGGDTTNLPGWQSLTAQDGNSTWGSVQANSACQIPTPAYADFAVLARNAVNYVPSYTMSNGSVAIPLQVESFGFGPVALSAPGLPSGVSASFNPSTLISGNSTLTLTAYSSATRQTVPVTIFATSGSRVHTVTEWVAVQPGMATARAAVALVRAAVDQVLAQVLEAGIPGRLREPALC